MFMDFHFADLLADGRGISQRVYGYNFQTIARPLFIEKVVAVIVQEVADSLLSVGVLREKVEPSIGADSLEQIQFHVAVPSLFINHYVVLEILGYYLMPVFRCKRIKTLFPAEDYVDHGHSALYNRNFPGKGLYDFWQQVCRTQFRYIPFVFVIDVQEPVSGDCAGIVSDVLNIGVDEGREILFGVCGNSGM